MTSSTALLVLGFLAAASAAPWPLNLPKCSTECPIAGAPKLAYAPQMTYVYSHSGKSRTLMKDVEGGNADMEWSSQVELTWLTPCDMAISIKNPSIGGGSGAAEAKFLEKYPLVVAITDGRVLHACSHPEDDVWSINLKKGIASGFQNSLPSNSSINTGLNFTETDIIGNCSTRYDVENQGEKVIVKKMKNHRYCQDYYINQAETPKSWPKAPLPIEESVSECEQEITKGIYTTITCTDTTIIRPAYGSYKYIEAHQESVLRFQSETDQAPPSVANLRGPLVWKSLRYDQETLKKDSSMVSKLDEVLKQVCEKTKESVVEDTASYVAKALHFLRRVPEEEIPRTLQKIRGGQICGDHQKLETLFLDAVAFIYEPGAVKVMVQELLSGKATGGRAALYTAALYFTPRPCIHSVEALKPLFENCQRFPRTAVAAASMVNTYCRQNPRCQEETPVRELAQTLSNKVGQQCSPPGNEETRKEALVLLKALGNMGVMNSEIARPLVQCIEKEEADKSIRVAATQAFRNVQCHPQFKQITKQLVNIAVDSTKDTEARIGSYLAAMKCADREDLRKITDRIYREENTQVRGFIFSHLLNIQESSAPFKEDLRYLLTSIVLPSNFTTDVRKYSGNIDLSYYAPTFGVGAGMESNVIYAPGSFLPRSVNLNLTAALGATPVNIGEIGARFEGLEPVLEELFGPEGYLRKTPTSRILEQMSSIMGDKLSKIMERLQGTFRQKRSIDFSTLSSLFDKLYGDRRSRLPKADFYARINDQEMAFASLAGDLKNINVDQLINSFFDSVEDMISMASNAEVDSVRTAQIYLDYHLPTMQGMPIKMKLEGTAVAGLKMETRLTGLSGGSPNLIKFIPSLSTQVDAFIGFDYHIAQVGIRMKNRVSTTAGASINVKTSSSNGFEIEVDLPEKMELINMKSETYLVKEVEGQPETKINPSSVRSTRFQTRSCMMALEPMLGLKLCFDINIPNVLRSEGLPLGPPATAKVILEKSDPSMRGYRMKGNFENTEGKKEIKVETEAQGSSTPRKANIMVSYSTQGDMAKLTCLLESQTTGGIKVEIDNKWTQSEKQLKLDAYASRSRQYTPDTKAFEAKLIMADNGQEVKVDTVFRTLATIKRTIDINFEASGDLAYSQWTRIPMPKRLRKFECTIASGRWHLISFIRKASDSQYSSAFKLGPMDAEWAVVEATHMIEGSSYRDMTLKTDLKGKIAHVPYETNIVIYNNDAKRGATLRVTREGGMKLTDLEMIFARSGETYKMNFLVDIPACIKPMKFEASAAHQGNSQYQIEAGAHHGQSVIFQVEGPVTARISSRMTELQTKLKVVCMRSQPFTVSTSVVSAQGKMAVAFELVNQSERMIAVEWNMASQDEQQTKMNIKLNIPSMIENNRIDAIISRKHIQLSFNNVVSPKSSSPRRVKGFTDVDFENKKVKADLFWDADKEPNMKLTMEGTIVSSSSTPQQTIVHGAWTYIGSTYRYKTEIMRSDPETWLFGKKDIKIELSTPSQKTHWLETTLNVEKESSGARVKAEIKYKNPESKQYTASSSMSMEGLGMPYNFKFSCQNDMISPEGRRASLSLETKHEKTPHQREVFVKIQVRSPSMSKPVDTSFTMMHQPSSYKAEWKIDVESPANGAQYELMLTPEGGVQSCMVGFNMKEIVDMLKAVERLTGMRSGSGSPREGSTYLIHYEMPTVTSHKVRIHSPSRKMEGEVKYSPTEYSVKVYPHRGSSESKYELSVTHSKTSSPWEEQMKYNGRFDHPSLERERKMEVMYTKNEEKTQGTVTLDIFPRSEDKITGTLESTMIARNSVTVEAKLSGKVLKVNPKVIVAASYAPHTVGFDILFEKNPSSRPSLVISGKYDRSSGRNAALAFTMKTEEGPVVEISGSVKPEHHPECNGLKISAVARSSIIGSYDISSELCAPAFMRMSMKKHGSDKTYMTRVGLQAIKNIELSVSEKDERSQEERHVSMMRMKLVSPTIINVEMKYKSDEASSLWEAFSEKWSMMSSPAMSWMENMCQEIFQQSGSNSPYTEMARLWQETKEEALRIYNDLVYDNMIPSYETYERWARSQTIRNLISGYKQMWSNVDELKMELYNSIPRTMKSHFEGLTQVVNAVVIGTARWMKTGEMPEEMGRLIEQVQRNSLWIDVCKFFTDMKRMIMEENEAIVEIFNKYKETLMKDIETIREDLMQNTQIQEYIDWIINHLHFEQMVTKSMEHVLDKVVQMSLLSSVQIRGNHIEIQIPIRQPVNSLPQAWKFMSLNPIPVPENLMRLYEAVTLRSTDYLVWGYYTLIPRHVTDLLPPFNRTAMVVDGSEILTFDGVVLRAPRSPCKVLLAAYKSHSLIMEHPQSSSSPQVTLKSTGVTVVIKPDHKVTVNGREVSGQEMTEGQVKVWKTSAEIKVLSPFMIVRVFPRNNVISVEVSGWTFGWVAGLLGTYDGEMTNDWATSQGSKASSLQELVRSWQEDQQCQTPSISFMSASQTPALRSLQCQALLGIRSRCTPVVRPEPFIKMCHSSRSACDVARAYNAICSSKGVKDVFPLTC
uniref:Vitellogenin 2 n=1 Tax=Pandalus japonicus TaxID=666362 RepID=V9XZL5_PANJP|nr:vitellogenin 2 [Pandalus japonicus]